MNPRFFATRSTALALGLFLSACASHPPPPEWLLTARSASEQHARLYLEGRDKLAQSALQKAREAVSRTGDAKAMAYVELHACSVKTASLYAFGCPDFAPLAQDAGAAENAYAAYLRAEVADSELSLLPPPQQMAWKNPPQLGEISEPLSRLLAAAVLLQAGRLPPAGMQVAIDTARTQGWRRPLANWLRLEEERLRRQGEVAAAAAIARQLERVLQYPE